MPKLKNPNATFWVIFKQCELDGTVEVKKIGAIGTTLDFLMLQIYKKCLSLWTDF